MTGVDRPVESFMILNGLEKGAGVNPGQKYKIVLD
jgi:predicted Zn-dependent protease